MEFTQDQLALAAKLSANSTEETKFKWSETFQKNLVGMLLNDKYFLIQSLDKIEPGYFSNSAHISIVNKLFDYFKKYDQLPKKFFLEEEILSSLKDAEQNVKMYYLTELEQCYDYYVPGLETRDALVDKIIYFAKAQAVKTAVRKSLEKVNTNPESDDTYIAFGEAVQRALEIGRNNESNGLEYFSDPEAMFNRIELESNVEDVFTTGFSVIDSAFSSGGIKRGEIGCWIGLPGTGKSLALVKAAVENVKRGHRVLYLTMEMDEVGIAERFTSMFTGFNINSLINQRQTIVDIISAYERDEVEKNKLIIKQFPGGELDVNGCRGFISQLQTRIGWKPDLLVLDYIGEMKDDPRLELHESRYRMIRDLRSYGVRNGHGTLSALQPNRTASLLTIDQYIDESNIGTSFDQFKPLDGFWSVNQTAAEKEVEVGRGFVIKHRKGKSRFPFKIEFDYKGGTLNMTEMADRNYYMRMNALAEKKTADIEQDFSSKKKRKSTLKSLEGSESTAE